MKMIKVRRGTGFLVSVSVAALLTLAMSIAAEVTTNDLPQIQAIYGGRINDVNSIELTGQPNVVRVFATTESANSIFYGDVDHALAAPYATNNFRFTVVPDFDAQANFGQVSGIAGHPDSGQLFVTVDEGLLSCDPTTAGTRVTNIVGQAAPPAPPGPRFSSILIRDSTLLAIGNMGDSNLLYFGAINASGNFTQDAGSPIPAGGAGGANTRALLVHPTNQCVYIYDCDSTNGLIKSSGAFNALSGATFSSVTVPPAISSWTGDRRLGIGPDGRLFVGGNSAGGNKVFVYSDNDGTSWTTVDSGLGGATGGNVECAGDTNDYRVYFGSIVSTNKGVTGSWEGIAQFGTFETHPNDGVVVADAIDPIIVYVTTDQGIGASTNGGHDLFEIDYGLEAVQIQDLDMNDAKTLAWTASKSGLRKGTGTPMALTWTPNGIFPMDDGSPFYSIAIDKDDTSGNTVYAANNKIYKTTDGSTTNWTKMWDIEGNTNGFENLGDFSALAVSGQTVAAGYYDPADATRGGLLVSSDGGNNWAQLMSELDVNDVLLMTNGILVAADYDSSTGTGGIFNVTLTTTTHELTDAVSIRNLAEDSSGGIYASGNDTNYAVKVYYKANSTSSWSAVSTLGISTPTQAPGGRGPVMTVGKDSNTNDLPIIAVGYSLYYLPAGGTTWQTSSALTYPDGSQINVLYWDELMVGTSEGLYGQNIVPADISQNSIMTGDYDGDSKTDPALYRADTGTWYVKLSAMSYGLVTLNFGGSGYQAVNGDFDGDGKADPAVYQTATPSAGSGQGGNWYVQLSGSGYAVATLAGFGGSAYEAVAGDYDGDGLTDPAIYNTANGDWQVAMSSLGYGIASASGFGGTGFTAVQENYDSDNRYDAAIYNTTNGNWTVLMSAQNYITATLWGFGGAGYTPVLSDFDGDGYADPAIYQETIGDWSVKLSGNQYATVTIMDFGGTGKRAAAADYDGDGKADPTLLDTATGIWHIKLSASGYATATLASGYTP
ncbi:MAG: hypothetical protein KKE37_12380 [Verrucomicrobia bacterium]|nr:hypothetical protein [Verrucomicrobiota bacterium]MBU4430134.1 hypothetical protein [Verrucomicrobiota bacterium]MCG2681041.1 hypothetical protein [Kiritimatiellia bacterium]